MDENDSPILEYDEVSKQIVHLKKLVKEKMDEATTASQQGNDEQLSMSLDSLARINSALGQKAAMAKYVSRLAARALEKLKEQKKNKRSELTLEYSKTQAVGKSEHQARVDTAHMEDEIDEFFNTSNLAQLLADEADDLTYRTDTFLKMGQSRLSLLKGDKHNGR